MEKQFKILTGLKFPISVLSPFLNIGLTEAILAESENEFLKRWLLIILVRCLSIMEADIFTTLTGILSGPFTFLASKLLVILSIWSTVAALIFSSAAGRNSFLILIMLG